MIGLLGSSPSAALAWWPARGCLNLNLNLILNVIFILNACAAPAQVWRAARGGCRVGSSWSCGTASAGCCAPGACPLRTFPTRWGAEPGPGMRV